MEKEDFIKNDALPTLNKFRYGDWSVICSGTIFIINNKGNRLGVDAFEGLEKVIFDTEKKTVTVNVKRPELETKNTRTLDLSEDTEFFEVLRENIDKILTERGRFKTVTSNEERTVFDVSYR